MALPSPTQWAYFSELRELLEPLSWPGRNKKLKLLRGASPGGDAQVVSRVALHFAMPASEIEQLGTGSRTAKVQAHDRQPK